MNPVFLTNVIQTPIQSIMCQNDKKVLRHLDGKKEVFIKFASSQTINVQKDRKSSQLQMHL